MEILWSRCRTKSGNQFIVVITDGFPKLTKAVPVAKHLAAPVLQTFNNQLVASFWKVAEVLSDIVPQFI